MAPDIVFSHANWPRSTGKKKCRPCFFLSPCSSRGAGISDCLGLAGRLERLPRLEATIEGLCLFEIGLFMTAHHLLILMDGTGEAHDSMCKEEPNEREASGWR